MQNICRFISTNNSPDPIQTINFVYERKTSDILTPKTEAVYKVCLVTGGRAKICLGLTEKEVEKDDIFFILPAVPYTISATDGFEYMYITYMGIRAGMIMERLGINRRNFMFEGYAEIVQLWKDGVACKTALVDLVSESILLYTFSAIGNRILIDEEKETDAISGNVVLAVKKHIDANFSDSELTLEKISKLFSYNKNYLSTAFKKTFKTGIREYLNLVRINNACALMEQNHTNIEEIASLCGFNDRMYFSRVFKQRMGISPKQHMKK